MGTLFQRYGPTLVISSPNLFIKFLCNTVFDYLLQLPDILFMVSLDSTGASNCLNYYKPTLVQSTVNLLYVINHAPLLYARHYVGPLVMKILTHVSECSQTLRVPTRGLLISVTSQAAPWQLAPSPRNDAAFPSMEIRLGATPTLSQMANEKRTCGATIVVQWAHPFQGQSIESLYKTL